MTRRQIAAIAAALGVVLIVAAFAVTRGRRASPRPLHVVRAEPEIRIVDSLAAYKFSDDRSALGSNSSSQRRVAVHGRYLASDVISAIASRVGCPIVQDASVRGTDAAPLTLNVDDAPWDVVVENLVQTRGLSIWRIGDVWLIETMQRTLDREKTAPVSTVAFSLERRHDLATIVKTIEPLLSERGVAVAFERYNSVVISDTEKRMPDVRRLMAHLDGDDLAEAEYQPPSFSGEPTTLNVRDAAIGDVLKTFAKMSGLSIIVDPDVRGTVTINASSVPWDNLLEVILRANGLTYTLDDRLMRILKEESLARPARPDNASARLTRIKPSELLPFARALRPLADIVVADDPSRTLTLRGNPRSVREALATFKSLDEMWEKTPEAALDRQR